MRNTNTLVISSEVVPYLPETILSKSSFRVPKEINDMGGQTRIFMPKYGLINERRHQLHEVIRLSGMNLVINDMDMPLIIKVASIPKERMQVYFIDNEDYFKRKQMLIDIKGKEFKDNDERMIFFTKGVLETVKKLNWSPDIINCHGWFTSLFPLYMKTYFKDEAIFSKSKIVTSIYENNMGGSLNKKLKDKIKFDDINLNLDSISIPDYDSLTSLALRYSDGAITYTDKLSTGLLNKLNQFDKPILDFDNAKKENGHTRFFEKYFL
ncbi:MAG: glycogen synthase [Flavobacteriaceae bacterium]|nr:glycogen synthase [Flavobacteriaceae bacterium]|tara:strand:- start:900 stop:1700 length:801 start_codon:yes stop_codon:yes gene_type:complete